jgi:predicted amidohydrolase
VPGTIVESHRDAEKEEDKLLNVCYFIDHEGNITGKYIKKNLWYVFERQTRGNFPQGSRPETSLPSSRPVPSCSNLA